MIVSYPSPWQLARMIYDYWTVWVSLPNDDPWYQQTVGPSALPFQNPGEGLFWYDGHNATFWYMLNLEWYRMNDKLYAYTNCKDPFDNYLRDFDKDYLEENYR